MIRFETVGMIEVAKNNPVLTSNSDVTNYSFITVDGDLYLVMNVIIGDDAYVEDAVIPAGEYLNGFLVEAWKSQKLVVDGKHITGGVTAATKNATLGVGSDGKLKTGVAPESGVYFKVTDTGVTLTEPAVKVKVCVA